MNKKIIISKVMSKLATNYPSDESQAKYKKLTPENAIAYAKLWEDYHGFKVKENARTDKKNEDGTEVIRVELEGGKDKNWWYPVWYDYEMGHLFGEY
jgi:hypothetical protein